MIIAGTRLNFAATPANDAKMRKLLNVDDSHVIIMFIAVARYRQLEGNDDEVVTTVSPRRSSYDFGSVVREIV